MLKSILEICVLTTAAAVVSSVCFGLLLHRLDVGVFCLLIVQYVFVCISSLYGFIYLKAMAARAVHAEREIREYNLWLFGCLLVASAQMSSMACVHL
jgi:hypothetical protein